VNCTQLSKDTVQTLLTNLQILLHEQNFLIGSITIRYSMKFSWQYYQNTNISFHALWISVKSFQSAMCKITVLQNQSIEMALTNYAAIMQWM